MDACTILAISCEAKEMGHCYHVNYKLHDDEYSASFRCNQALASFNDSDECNNTRMRANCRRDIENKSANRNVCSLGIKKQ